ncbi:MAG: hypothetical protein ACK5MR_12190 [Cumulibacter sp.]
MSELVTILLGALSGGAVSWALGSWQLRSARRDRLADARLDLARRIARHKNGPELARCLNEIPVLFGGDAEIMALYRKAQPDQGVADMNAVIELIQGVARAVGLAAVSADDLSVGFQS